MARKKKINFWKRNYAASWDFIKESRNFIYAAIGIFIFSSLIGYFAPIPEEVSTQLLDFLKQLVERTQGMGQVELNVFIFSNNVMSSFFGMIFGILLGIYPVFSALANGFLIGFVSRLAVASSGFVSLLSLVPHGIFELPAIFISLGIGLKLGSFIFQKEKSSFKDLLVNSLRVFVFVVIPLLIVASVIETAFICYFGVCG